MKKFLFVSILLLTLAAAFAQIKPKPKAKEKPPTQKEMEAMMKEAQMEMDNMDPETKKFMDSMGIKTPSFKNVPKVSDKQMKEAWENENRIVPQKDAVRTAAIPQTPLTNTSVVSYIAATQTKVNSVLKPAAKNVAEKIYAQLKASYTPSAAGNAATALWLIGKNELAIYIMGKVCADDPTNTDNLSNYASMLSMNGGEHLAIPVLNYLNSKYRNNSTILNNIGQAWFGLGDIAKSEKYLDSVIRMYAYHPQANLTKSLIEEEKGNKTEAVNLVKKSISHSYSQEKEERLRKLGYKLTGKDVTLPPPTKADLLNLGGFGPPPFPKSVEECIALEPQWATFRQQVNSQTAALDKQLKEAWKTTLDMQQKRNIENISMIRASVNAGSPQGSLNLVPMRAGTAYLKLKDVTDQYDRQLGELTKKIVKFITETGVLLKEPYDREIEKLQEEDLEQTGEGKPNKDFCPKYEEVSDKFLRAYNSQSEILFKENLDLYKKFLNEQTHWLMYSEWPEKFEAHKLEAKIAWLKALLDEPPLSFESITKYKCASPPLGKAGKLSEFDDVACQYHSELNFIVFKMKSDCSRQTTEFDAKFLKFKLKQDMDKETFGDQFMNCTVEVKATVGSDKMNIGPLAIGAKAEGGIGVEIERSGVKDVYLIGGVKAEAGFVVSVEPQTGSVDKKTVINAGIQGKISIISGNGSIDGSGIFKGLK